MECYPLPVADDKDDEEPEKHGDDHGTDWHDQLNIHLFFCTCGMDYMIDQKAQMKDVIMQLHKKDTQNRQTDGQMDKHMVRKTDRQTD